MIVGSAAVGDWAADCALQFLLLLRDVRQPPRLALSLAFTVALSGAVHAFLWTTSGGMVDLGPLGGLPSGARAINDAAQVTGRGHTGAGQPHAFVWTDSTSCCCRTSAAIAAFRVLFHCFRAGVDFDCFFAACASWGVTLLNDQVTVPSGRSVRYTRRLRLQLFEAPDEP